MSKILIIEDEQEIAVVLSYIMKSAGHEAFTAFGGEEGLALAEAKRPNLILLDIMMPNMDGFEVIKRMKKSENLRSIPIIVITAKTNFLEENEALEKDIAGYVIKPFEIGPLLAQINKTLSGGRPSAE